MMNGLQTLKQWKEAFNNPSGSMVSYFFLALLFSLMCTNWLPRRFLT